MKMLADAISTALAESARQLSPVRVDWRMTDLATPPAAQSPSSFWERIQVSIHGKKIHVQRESNDGRGITSNVNEFGYDESSVFMVSHRRHPDGSVKPIVGSMSLADSQTRNLLFGTDYFYWAGYAVPFGSVAVLTNGTKRAASADAFASHILVAIDAGARLVSSEVVDMEGDRCLKKRKWGHKPFQELDSLIR